MINVKNAINNDTGELIYIKGHALATYMSDGRSVEEAINSFNSNSNLDGYATEQWVNDQGFVKELPSIPSKTSDLTNDSGFITINDIPSLDISDEYITESELNDKGYLTEHQDISHLASKSWVESQGYAHQEDLLEITFNDIQDSPISDTTDGELNIIDESGNIGVKVTSEAIYAKDFVTENISLVSLISRINSLETKLQELTNIVNNLNK